MGFSCFSCAPQEQWEQWGSLGGGSPGSLRPLPSCRISWSTGVRPQTRNPELWVVNHLLTAPQAPAALRAALGGTESPGTGTCLAVDGAVPSDPTEHPVGFPKTLQTRPRGGSRAVTSQTQSPVSWPDPGKRQKSIPGSQGRNKEPVCRIYGTELESPEQRGSRLRSAHGENS